LVARLPLLAGFRRFDLLLVVEGFAERDLEVEAWLVPDFVFALPDVLVLLLAVFSFVDVDDVAAGF
jgi:hypothetical protein